MIKPIFFKLSVCACAIALTACGASRDEFKHLPINSGGGYSSSRTDTTTTFGGVATKSTYNTQSQQTTEMGKQINNISGSNLSSVVVDGHAIDLKQNSLFSENNRQIINNDFSYMRFGTYRTQKDNIINTYTVSYGQITPLRSVPPQAAQLTQAIPLPIPFAVRLTLPSITPTNPLWATSTTTSICAAPFQAIHSKATTTT